MAAWVQAGNRKLNLDRATWIDRTDDGAVHVVFDGALNHTFHGEVADAVWRMVVAQDTDNSAATRRATSPAAPKARARRQG